MLSALPGFLFWWFVIDIVCIAAFDIGCSMRGDEWRKAEDDEQARALSNWAASRSATGEETDVYHIES